MTETMALVRKEWFLLRKPRVPIRMRCMGLMEEESGWLNVDYQTKNPSPKTSAGQPQS